MWQWREIHTKIPPPTECHHRAKLRTKTKTIKISTYLLRLERTRRIILWEQKKCWRMELLQDPHCHEMKVGPVSQWVSGPVISLLSLPNTAHSNKILLSLNWFIHLEIFIATKHYNLWKQAISIRSGVSNWNWVERTQTRPGWWQDYIQHLSVKCQIFSNQNIFYFQRLVN